jgi:hypothetical protein
LQYVDMGDVADVSEVHAASVFRVLFFFLPVPVETTLDSR